MLVKLKYETEFSRFNKFVNMVDANHPLIIDEIIVADNEYKELELFVIKKGLSLRFSPIIKEYGKLHYNLNWRIDNAKPYLKAITVKKEDVKD